MTTALTAKITIAAPPEQVWADLIDLPAYRDWNPFIVEAHGTVVQGARLTLRMRPVDGSEATVRPTLLSVEPSRRLRWLGRLGVPGLFDAEHDFTLRPTKLGTTLTQSETFRGILVPLFARRLRRSTLPAFTAMNEALKRRVEQRAQVGARAR